MAGNRERTGRSPVHDEYIGTWLQPLPQPDVKEGGESTWALWHEASRELDAMFGPTLPSEAMPLSAGTQANPARPGGDPLRLSADELMVQARRNNRICPRPALWAELHGRLGGLAYADLPPPPVDWMWTKLSAIQKRLLFREYLEWAQRHGKLPEVARFMEALGEADWLHMGEM